MSTLEHRFAIKERLLLHSDSAPALAYIEAETETDALALYSIGQGFADPRQFIGEPEDFFYRLPNGGVGMVFTNTELLAVREEERS